MSKIFGFSSWSVGDLFHALCVYGFTDSVKGVLRSNWAPINVNNGFEQSFHRTAHVCLNFPISNWPVTGVSLEVYH